MVAEVLMRLPQSLMLHLHGGLASVEVDGAGLELPTLTFELTGNLFFLLQLLLPLCHHQLSQGNNAHTLLKILMQPCIGDDAFISFDMSFMGLL
jgi:hypothetical protein